MQFSQTHKYHKFNTQTDSVNKMKNEKVNKIVFMITLSFLNQTLWCDPHWNRVSETIPMSGNIIGFGWEIRKLAFWKLSILDPICCPVSGAWALRTGSCLRCTLATSPTLCGSSPPGAARYAIRWQSSMLADVSRQERSGETTLHSYS